MSDEAAVCGQIRPGNYSSAWIPVCDLPQGHVGLHECPASYYIGRPWWWPLRYSDPMWRV